MRVRNQQLKADFHGYLDAETAKTEATIVAALRGVEFLREYGRFLIGEVVTGKVDVREGAAQLPKEPAEEETEFIAEETAIKESDGANTAINQTSRKRQRQQSLSRQKYFPRNGPQYKEDFKDNLVPKRKFSLLYISPRFSCLA